MKNKIFRQSSRRAGFTLVELLVVIAIIGILSSVAVVNLNSARDKARVASMQASMSGLVPGIILCFDENQALNNPTSVEGGGKLCTGSSATWPTPTGSFNWVNPTSASASGTFYIGASSTGALGNVWCTHSGCSSN